MVYSLCSMTQTYTNLLALLLTPTRGELLGGA